MELARQLRIKRQTVKSVVMRSLRSDERRHQHRGFCYRKVDQMMRDAVLQDIINENPLSTTKAIKAALQSRFPEKPVISDSCVGSVLDKMLITLKISRDVPAPVSYTHLTLPTILLV